MNYSKRPLKKHQKIKDKLEKAYCIETDDEDDVNDLDLEVEEIKDT